ncbi:aspartic proteinase NANA, chloroplast-like [Zingiber officinale]|nr:aspartic proteinase NANA, chloroplast-like [Zingiber officinale]
MPMTSGAYAGTGQYFVRFLLGTPARPFLLVVDTGSDLTWAKCRLRGRRRRHRVFHPASSKTFRIIPCAAEMCKNDLPFSLSACPTPTSPCRYDYKYSDDSSAQGVYANESATVILAGRRRAKLRGLVVGCTATFSGASFWAADGVLGLGNSVSSFAERAAASFGGGFSYCLVDHLSLRNASSFLRFGPARPPAAAPVHETPLVLDLQPFYGVGIMGISVDGKILAIPAIVWDFASGGGTIVDSGTSLTLLAEPAYGLVVGALSRRLTWAPRVSMDPFEFCYNWTAATAEEKAGPVPAMVVHLAGGARLDPPEKSYLIDVADGVKCLGIQPSPWPGVSTLGNILQQEHLWEFDVENQRLRFSRSTCHAN